MNLSEKELKLEEEYLKSTINVLNKQISSMAQELYESEEKQKEFKRYMWDSKADLDPTEMKTLIGASDLEVEIISNKAEHYKKLYRIQNNPYFAKITFETEGNIKDIYIGLTYLKENYNNIIYDWRAPISSLFYDYEAGKCSYESPGGTVSGYLHNKRQFTIEDQKLKRVFDSKLNVQDELLQEVLANNSNDLMKNIVNTIQQEQNKIIRNTKDRNLIVQGIAGSGKTSVALHRIAFLLYKIKNLTSDKVLIFAPNNVFSEYISNVLPELGEDNTKESTLHSFFKSYISEYKKVETFTSFIEKYYKGEEPNPEFIKIKQSDNIIPIMEEYIKNLTNKVRFTAEIFNHDLYLEKEKLNHMLTNRYSNFPLMERIDAIADKISEQHFRANKSKTKTIRKWLLERLNIKIDMIQIYKDFFKSKEFKDFYPHPINEYYIKKLSDKEISYDDACLFIYMKGLIFGFNYDYTINLTVVDEAQDYSKLQYILLKKILKKSDFSILGDVNQTINPYYKYESLEDIRSVFDNNINYVELTKTYRSSPEIIEHANKILGLELVSAIRRENNIPVILKDETNIIEDIKLDIDRLKSTCKSIAIITKTDDEANKLYNKYKKIDSTCTIINNNSSEYKKGIIFIPSYMAKGLEFDATIIYTEKDNYYKDDEKYLYYVACTRSQHHLIIYNQKK